MSYDVNSDEKPDSNASLIITCPNGSPKLAHVWLNGVDISHQLSRVEFVIDAHDKGKPKVALHYRGDVQLHVTEPELEEVGK